jgi:hypothetical protein
MKLSEWILALVIIAIFLILQSLGSMTAKFKEIKDRWPEHRCSPSIMPFAGYFGHDPVQNFNECIQDMQTNYMSYILAPVNYAISGLTSVAGSFGDALNSARLKMASMTSSIMSIVEDIMRAFLGMFNSFAIIIDKIKDTLAKMVGIMMAMVYLMIGNMLTLTSIWKGPPGQTMRAVAKFRLPSFCFAGETKIKLKNGKIRKMKNIEIGDVLSDGSIVYGTMILKNKGKEGYLSKMCVLKGKGVQKEDIIVSEGHLVKDGKEYIHVYEHEDSEYIDENYGKLYCLITNTHKIKIGKMVFGDWEDEGILPMEIRHEEKKVKLNKSKK